MTVTAADYSVSLEALADRTAWLRARFAHVYNVANYGALGDGVTNDTAAIVAAIAAATVLGGVVMFPPGLFLHTQFSVPGNVSLQGTPDQTFLMRNHATQHGIVLLGDNLGGAAQINDTRFLGAVAGTGFGVLCNASARVQFNRCSWNGWTYGGGINNNLDGTLVSVGDAAAELDFYDCQFTAGADVDCIAVSAGRVAVHGGTMIMPATYTSALVRGTGTARLAMRGVAVDCTARAAGATAEVLFVDAGVRADMIGCGVDGVGAVNTLYGFLWAAGATVVSSANRWLGNVTPYAGNTALAGSVVQLTPATELANGVGTAINLSALIGYRSILVDSAAPSTPTVTLPAGVFKGQRLTLTLKNTGSNWAGVTVTGAAPSGYSAVLASGVKTLVFEYVDYPLTGTPQWVCISERG